MKEHFARFMPFLHKGTHFPDEPDFLDHYRLAIPEASLGLAAGSLPGNPFPVFSSLYGRVRTSTCIAQIKISTLLQAIGCGLGIFC